ncbi:M15 family metallopeptidase [Subsaxibacter sp. CAU 1640]|uniref:M15 family metallopeptidase n=1 Tax=Subsaxibacter sp. CAU 1640 TaxID=2933271 RepID=UPI002005486B|nr:M15 family metallopeptidase [Subsaxibacter sp. CAU 1640]MCK7590175.1 M15 family metallopeptidase [Subsaxibacter sp. CAU 1640]
MNRNHFLKLSSISTIALAAFPYLILGKNDSTIFTSDELIGKGTPDLYGKGFKLRKDAFEAFLKMKKDAQSSGIELKVVSSYRDFEHQNSIWTRKYKKYVAEGLTPEQCLKKIIEYSTIPGSSRHHWATDLDLVDASVQQPKNVLNPSHFDTEGCFWKFKKWMDDNANSYGFYLVYTNNVERKGFKYEPWHYSFKPLSVNYLKAFKQLNLTEILRNESILGKEYFSNEFLDSYFQDNVLDINPELL